MVYHKQVIKMAEEKNIKQEITNKIVGLMVKENKKIQEIADTETILKKSNKELEYKIGELNFIRGSLKVLRELEMGK